MQLLAPVVTVLAVLSPLVQAQTQTFLSAPGQTAVTLKVTLNQESATAPGYIFIAPFHNSNGYGPHIFKQDGTLVWVGNYTVKKRAVDFRVCNYLGSNSTHLCYNDAIPKGHAGHSYGTIRFFDNTYKEVQNYGAVGGLPPPDIHELNAYVPANGNAFIQDAYQTVGGVDLTSYGGPKNGYIYSGCFQDRDIPSGTVTFTWCSYPQIPLSDSFYPFHTGGGTKELPFDYFHINSIDRDKEGNYYVSARQTHSIYKIAGPAHASPGSIISVLGGKASTFTLNGFNFSWQHHQRVHSVAATQTTMSLFDNDAPGTATTASSGIFLVANNASNTAVLTERYINPSFQIAEFEGSCQVLDGSSNRFLGWGSLPTLSEHTKGNPGPPVYYATMIADPTGNGNNKKTIIHSYRSWKFPWAAQPAYPPRVFAYQRACGAATAAGPLAVYMSWNGATAVAAWAVFGAASATAPGTQLQGSGNGGTVPVAGFETAANFTPRAFQPYVYVQARDAGGALLGTSARVAVFVPARRIAGACGAVRCAPGTVYSRKNSRAGQC